MPVTKSEQWPVSQFYKAYINGELVKPRIQRKMRWDSDRHVSFINFLNTHRNGVMPFLVNEIIIDGKKRYVIFDGNNRSNAILLFQLSPLEYFKELIPASYSPKIQEALCKASLDTLINKRYSLMKFCSDNGLKEEYSAKTYSENVSDEAAWDIMAETLTNMEFNNIILPFSVFSNLTEKEMCDIYEAINTEGVKLTRQELLASNTSTILFTASTLLPFKTLLKILNEQYYEGMNATEKLQIDTNSSVQSINLFELLVSFQIYLAPTYEFIPIPCEEKNGLDIIFKVYDAITGGFDIEHVPANINAFLEKIEKGCHLVKTYLNRFYTDKFEYTGIKQFRKLSGNQCIQLIVYIIDALNHDIPLKTIEDSVRRVILYHSALSAIPKEVKDTVKDLAIDSIRYEAGGTFIPNQLKNIKASHCLEYVPTNANIKSVLQLMIKSDTVPCLHEAKPRSRKTLSKAKALALSAFMITHVPAAILDNQFNKDHIVPWSSKWVEEIDIDRLGNFVLIPEAINKARGKKPITDAWIQENALKYMEYPTEPRYKQVFVEGLVNKKAYNTLCDAREAIYIEAIMKLV